jgi:hypothetical protein
LYAEERVKGIKNSAKPADVRGFAEVDYIQVVSLDRRAVQDGRDATDQNEIDARFG